MPVALQRRKGDPYKFSKLDFNLLRFYSISISDKDGTKIRAVTSSFMLKKKTKKGKELTEL